MATRGVTGDTASIGHIGRVYELVCKLPGMCRGDLTRHIRKGARVRVEAIDDDLLELDLPD